MNDKPSWKAAALIVLLVCIAVVSLWVTGVLQRNGEPTAVDESLRFEDIGLLAQKPGREQARSAGSVGASFVYPIPPFSPEEREGGGPARRTSWFWQQRAYPLDSIPVDANLRALRHTRRMPAPASAGEAWTSLGPAPIQDGVIGISSCTATSCQTWHTSVSGRTKAIAFHPTDPSIMYIGTATGGVWKSSDGGNTFAPLTDSAESFAISSLAIDHQDPNVIYAGTGEIGTYYGVGILKSTDGGQTWNLLGESAFAGMVVTSILIHPANSNALHVSTASPNRYSGKTSALPGVFRSADGGQNWQGVQCSQPCYGFTDLVMENTNPQVLYAAGHGVGIFKSTNGGVDWVRLPGFPDKGYGRIELAIGQGTGSGTIYAGLDAKINEGGQLKPWGVIVKSADHGQSWQVLDLNTTPNYCSSQCWYDNIIAVDPRDANVVYIGGNMIPQGDTWAGVVHKSTNGGLSWQDMTPGDAQDHMTHPDMHAIAFDPNNPDIVWVGNDGGLFRSPDGGQTWEHRNSSLGTLQFVNIAVHPTDPNIAFGGLQDNAKAKYDGTGWSGLDIGDGGNSEIDPFDANIWYSTRYSLQGVVVQFQRNELGGTAPMSDWPQYSQGIDKNDRMQFYVPFEVDRSNAGVIYLGTHRLYRTTNRGDSWSAISSDLTKGQGSIMAIGVSPSDSNTVYVGASDGNVQVTTNLGGIWTNVTKSPLPNRQVQDFSVHPTASSTAYVVYTGYNTHTPDSPGHVFKTTNGGESWQDVSGNLPDIPVLTIVVDPEQPEHIYIGTDIGVYSSTDGGTSWASFNQGLANVPVYDLEFNQHNRMLWAGTFGRGVYRLSVSGSDPTPTNTPVATASPTPPVQVISLPVVLRNYSPGAAPPATPTPGITPSPSPSPTPTATPPQTGPYPGAWEGERTTFNVTGDQQKIWDVRIQAPVPGCDSWVSYSDLASISAGEAFSYTVDLRENGLWRNSGAFLSSTSAQGTAEFLNVYFGTSCGTWSGTVDWTAAWTASAPDPTATATSPPPTPTATPPSVGGIHGQVRNQGSGVAEIGLLLRQCPTNAPCDFETSKVMTTTTDTGGYYSFVDVPELPADNFYFVHYFNHQDGSNTPDDRYLWRWYTPKISTYAAGASIEGGSFEISEILLKAPTTPTVTLPATFEWTQRDIPGEYYAWELFDLTTGATLCTSIPSQSDSFALNEDELLNDCGGSFGTAYGWFAWALDHSDWSGGYGDSYYYASITFHSSAAATATPTATPTDAGTPTPTPTPSATPAPGSGIYGQVLDGGAAASGITLLLYHCDSYGTCIVTSFATTGSGGNYDFTSAATLSFGESYYVAFVNGASGGNSDDPNHLSYWRSLDITSYTAGSSVEGGTFDIADVVLLSPPDGSSRTLPTTFTWDGRGVSGDRYSWAIADPYLSELYYVDPPVDATVFVLDEALGGAIGLYYDTEYPWYVYVADGSWAGGYGVSYYYRSVTFSAMSYSQENRFPGAGETPSLAPAERMPGGWLAEPKPYPPAAGGP